MGGARKRNHSSDAPAESADSKPAKKAKKNKPSTTLLDANSKNQKNPPNGDTPKCIVCLDSSQYKRKKTLQCSHTFHEGCINKWLTENRSCPICRKVPPPTNNRRPLAGLGLPAGWYRLGAGGIMFVNGNNIAVRR